MEEIGYDLSYVNDLIPVLKQYDSNICEEDLRNPDSTQMIGIVLAIFDQIGMNVDMFFVPQSHSVKIFENNPASHKTSLKFVNIYMITKLFLQHLGVDDFTFGDMMRPRQPRTARFLSVLTRFIKVKEENNEILCTKIRQIVDLEDRIQTTTRQIEEIDQLIPLKTQEAEAHKQSNSSKLSKITEMETKLSQLKTSVKQQSLEFENLKKLIVELSQRLKDLKAQNEELRREHDKLTDDIVRSPQKIIEDAEVCQRKLDYLTAQVKEYKTRLDEAVQERDEVDRALERFRGCEHLLDGVNVDLDKIKKIDERCCELRARNEELSTCISNTRSDIQLYTEQLEIKVTATEKLEANMERQRDQAKRNLDHIKSTKERDALEIRDLQTSLKRLNDEVQRKQEELDAINPDADDDIERYNMLCEVSSAIYSYENALRR